MLRQNLSMKILSIAHPLPSMLNSKLTCEEKQVENSGLENWLPWSVLIISVATYSFFETLAAPADSVIVLDSDQPTV